ncbi:hypothetical protein FO519_008734 [Halicephalobus sp. NKZ332]|nr:hypothetical protein FO519_008734 [Halicephalobus sp. NKZ332]
MWNYVIDSEHYIFADIVNLMSPNCDIDDFIKEKIISTYTPVQCNIIYEDDIRILEIKGRKLIVSSINSKLAENNDEYEDIKELRFVGFSQIEIDEDLTVGDLNVSLISPAIVIVGKRITWDLSGEKAKTPSYFKKKAKSGTYASEDGEDGFDGPAGNSAGNIYIETKEVVNAEAWEIKLNGGRGHDGGDGGDGANGEDGIGAKYNDHFGTDLKIAGWTFSAVNTLFGGLISRTMNNTVNSGYNVWNLANGVEKIENISTYYCSTHFFSIVKGTKGKPGGRGGRNGLGGEGGKKGNCTIKNRSDKCSKFNIQIEANDGERGNSGKTGNTGEYGLDGWDLAVSRKTLGSWCDYGTRNQTKKVEMSWTSNYSDDTLYVESRYTGSGSKCYARIVDVRDRTRKTLADSEKFGEIKVNSELRGDSIAKKSNAINTRAIAQKYSSIFDESVDSEKVLEQEKETDKQVEMNRLAMRMEFPKEPVYEPKKKIELKKRPNGVSINSADLWETVVSYEQLDDILTADDPVKLAKKKLIAKLRHETVAQRTSKGAFAQTIRKWVREQKKETNQNMKVLEAVHHAKLVRNAEENQRDCFQFLRPRDNDGKGVSVCTDVLLGSQEYSSVISDSLEKCVKGLLTPDTYTKLSEIFSKCNGLKLQGKPIADHQLYLDRFFGAFIAIQQKEIEFEQINNEWIKFSTKVSPEEKKAALTCFNDFKELNEIKDLKFSDDYANLKIPKSIASLDIEFLFYFLNLKQLIETNNILAEAVKLIVQVTAKEEDHLKFASMLGSNSNSLQWITFIQDKEILRKYCGLISQLGYNCAAGRLLLAWDTKVNLRIYHNECLLEDHYPESKLAFHVELYGAIPQFRLLRFNIDYIEKNQNDKNAITLFDRELKNVEGEFQTKILSNNVTIIQEYCKTCKIMETKVVTDKETGQLNVRITDVVNYLKMNGPLSYTLQENLELLCEHLPHLGLKLLDCLLAVFDTEGCYINSEDLEFYIDIIFTTSKEPAKFPQILLSIEQDTWLDEFVIFSIENSFSRRIIRKLEFFKRLSKIPDDRLKILLCQKLKGTKMSENNLLELLKLMADAHGAYPELRELPVSNWSNVITDSHVYYHLSAMPCSLESDEKKLAIFWCIKLSDVYGIKETEAIYTLMASLKHFGTSQEPIIVELDDEEYEITPQVLGRLVQRLCNREVVAGDDLEPKNIFALLCSKISPASVSLKKYKSLHSTVEEALIELIQPPTNEERTSEELIQLLKKCNSVFDGPSPKIEQLINEISDHLDDSSEDYEEYLEKAEEDHIEKPSDFMKMVKAKMDEDEDLDHVLLMIVDAAIYATRGFNLRSNQKAAIIAALKCDRSLLQQIATGEGKSLIIATLSIISVLKDHQVNVVTSSSTLAKRDTESEPPKGFTDLYHIFGITAGHICVEDSNIRQAVYSSCHIIYGDLTSFQRDYLLDKFYGMNIIGSRSFDVVLVDEVDSMLLDQGNNMLYLSHEIPDIERLQPLFVRIWQTVCGSVDTNGAIPFETEQITQSIRRSLFPVLELDSLDELLDIDSLHATILKEILIKEGIADPNGVLFIENTSEVASKLSKLVEDNILTRLSYSIELVLQGQYLAIPKHLHTFIKQHLTDFVKNAKNAYFMQEGKGYQVDIMHVQGASLNYEPRIIIVDSGTGVDLPTTQWSNGLHQFLQLKHGCRLTAVSLKAVFVSNVSFLKKFDHIYGFSGTLGAVAERKQLEKLYDVNAIIIPSSMPKLLVEEYSHVSSNHENWVAAVFENLKEMMINGRSVLIICDSIKQVNQLSRDVLIYATKMKKEEMISSEIWKCFKEALLYRRDKETFEYGDGNRALEVRKIIYSTNLAGRGTDIKLEEELVENGGLHVIVAFLPDNLRVEEQAFGRAARCGEPGSAQLIILNKEFGEANISRLKMRRNALEEKRILAITNFYNESIKIEEDCFQTFADCFDKHRKRLDNITHYSEEQRQVLLKDLLDRWAYWLDAKSIEKSSVEERVAEAASFCETLSLGDGEPVQPMNRLRCGIMEALNSNYDTAKGHFDYIINEYPDFCAEAMYYKGFLIMKQNRIYSIKDKPYQQVKKLFDKVYFIMDAWERSCYNDRAIIEHYKSNNTNSLFIIDCFSEQQKQTAQMTNLFKSSIERLTGGRISYEDFVTPFMKPEAAHGIYDLLSNNEVLTNTAIKKGHTWKDYDEDGIGVFGVANLCQKNVIMEKLKTLKKQGTVVNYEAWAKVFPMPHMEEFWEQLQCLKAIKNEENHTFINKQMLGEITVALAEKLNFFILKESKKNKEKNDKKDDKSIISIKSGNNKNTEKPKESDSADKSGEKEAKDTGLVKIWMHKVLGSESAEDKFALCDGVRLRNSLPARIWKTLIEIGVIVETKSAILIDESKTEVMIEVSNKNNEKVRIENFKSFSSLKLNDFTNSGITEEEGKKVMTALCAADVLVEVKDKLHLLDTKKFSDTKIPGCYLAIVQSLLKQKLAYVMTYRVIQNAVKEGSRNIQISLPSKSDTVSQMMDLVDSNVLEFCNVDYDGLAGSQKDDGIFSSFTGWAKDGHESRNLKDIIHKVEDELSKAVMNHEYQTYLDGQNIHNQMISGVRSIFKDVIVSSINKVKQLDKLSSGNSSKAKSTKEIRDDTFGKDKINPYDCLRGNAVVAQLKQIFDDKSGITRFEAVNAELVDLFNKMGECNLIQIRDTSLYVKHGATHIIEIKNVASKWKLAGVLAFAIVQMAVGATILIFTCGAGSFAGQFCIGEGISDLIFAIQGFTTGTVQSYRQHKMISLVASAALCGVGAYFTSGTGGVNAIVHSIRGGAWATKTGVNLAATKGFTLITREGFKKVLSHAFKIVAKRVGSALLNLGVGVVLKLVFEQIIQLIVEGVRKIIMTGVYTACDLVGNLQETIIKALKYFGPEKGQKITESCGAFVLSKDQKDIFGSLCDAIFVQCRPIIHSIGSGAQYGGDNATAQMIKTAVNMFEKIFVTVQLAALVQEMKDKVESSMNEINDQIHQQIEDEKKRNALLAYNDDTDNGKDEEDDGTDNGEDEEEDDGTDNGEDEEEDDGTDNGEDEEEDDGTDNDEDEDENKSQNNRNSEEVDSENDRSNEKKKLIDSRENQKICDDLIEKWKEQLGKRVDAAIQQRVVVPLMAFATNRLSSLIENVVAVNYQRFMASRDETKREKLEKQYEKEKQTLGKDQAQANFEKRLENLYENTRSPEVVAKIIANGVKLDMTAASASANLISEATGGGPVILRITNEDGEIITHAAGVTKENEANARVISIDLNKEHYGNEANSSRNSCFYGTLIKAIPQLREVFPNDEAFRQGLGGVLVNDPYFRNSIQQGWHTVAVQKRYLGGDLMKSSDDLNRVQNQMIADTKIAKNELLDFLLTRKRKINEVLRNQPANEVADIREDLEKLNELIKDLQNFDENSSKDGVTEGKRKAEALWDQYEKCLKTIDTVRQKTESDSISRFYESIRESDSKNSQLQYTYNDRLNMIPTNELKENINDRFPLNPEQEKEIMFLRNIATFIGNLEGKEFPKETITDPKQPDRRNSTFVAFTVPQGKKTLYISPNYYSEHERSQQSGQNISPEIGQLTYTRQQAIINKLIEEHGDQLKKAGYKNIQFVRHDYDDSSNDSRTLFQGAHKGHAEMVALHVGQEKARENSVPFDGSGLIMGVNKDHCIKCAASLDNSGVPITLGTGVQLRVPRFVSPSNIKLKWGPKFPL